MVLPLVSLLTWLLAVAPHPRSATPADAPGSPPDVRAFRPTTHGFKFRNAFKGSPLPISLGALDDALGVPSHYGLCGGMSAAAADFFLAGRTPPTQRSVPSSGSSLYDYIFDRQVDSLGAGMTEATRFARWMRLPDHGVAGTRAQSLAAIAQTRATIDRGAPVMLGLVLTSRKDKGKLWENHQVMAYDVRPAAASTASAAPPASAHATTPATPAAASWTILIYDPNFPGIDDARLELRLTCEGTLRIPTAGALSTIVPILGVTTVRRATGKLDTPVRGVFLMPYNKKTPKDSL